MRRKYRILVRMGPRLDAVTADAKRILFSASSEPFEDERGNVGFFNQYEAAAKAIVEIGLPGKAGLFAELMIEGHRVPSDTAEWLADATTFDQFIDTVLEATVATELWEDMQAQARINANEEIYNRSLNI